MKDSERQLDMKTVRDTLYTDPLIDMIKPMTFDEFQRVLKIMVL